jgi:hypothetical protein
MFLGTFLAAAVSVVWVLSSNQWRQADQADPRKILAQEVVATVKARVPWISRNGSKAACEGKESLGSADLEEKRVLGRLDRQPPTEGPEER